MPEGADGPAHPKRVMGLSSPMPKVQHASPAPGISTMSDSAPDQAAQTPDAAGDAAAGPTPKVLAVTCVFAAVVGVVVSLAAWCFLELVQIGRAHV